jgi:hypothetical protein
MFDKILAKLKEQRGENSHVSDRTLEDLARSLESLITSDEILEKSDFTAAIKSVAGNLNYYAGEAVKTAAEKKKEEEAKKKAEEEAKKKKAEEERLKKNLPPNEEIPTWAKGILDKQEALLTELNTMKSDKVKSVRSEKLKKTLEGTPDFYSKPFLQGFSKLRFDSEDDFETYLTEISKAKNDFIQTSKEKGISFPSTPPPKKEEEDTGQTPVLGDAIKLVQKQKELTTKKNE